MPKRSHGLFARLAQLRARAKRIKNAVTRRVQQQKRGWQEEREAREAAERGSEREAAFLNV